MTLFLDIKNSRLPLNKIPPFAKIGASMVYALVGICGLVGRGVIIPTILSLYRFNVLLYGRVTVSNHDLKTVLIMIAEITDFLIYTNT